MTEELAINIENVSKVYKLYNSPLDRLKESLNPQRKQYHNEFYALKDINFKIKRGDSVGLIGQNGSGKSTLLKIITGILTPTKGNVTVNGKISALLELGAGFNPELSGIENVYFNGMMMGYSRLDMDERLDDILSFADIGEFVHQPVKTYSSGMFVRLAFAVAVNVEPEILIIDEALSVGDSNFQEKCFKKIHMLMERATLIYVSHDMASIQVLCNRAIVLNRGVQCFDGMPYDATLFYYKTIRNNNDNILQPSIATNNTAINLENVKLTDKNGNVTNNIESGEPFCAEITLYVASNIDNLAVGIMFRNVYGMRLFGLHSYHQCSYDFGDIQPNTRLTIKFKSVMQLCPGQYVVSVGITRQFTDEDYEHLVMVERCCEVGVFGNKYTYGMFVNKNVDLESVVTENVIPN